MEERALGQAPLGNTGSSGAKSCKPAAEQILQAAPHKIKQHSSPHPIMNITKLKALAYAIRDSSMGSKRKRSKANKQNRSPTPPPISHDNADAQLDSPLFKLPREIRDYIYDFALTPWTEKKIPYDREAYYYRPNYRYGDWHLNTALLRTCRRIHMETHHLPASHCSKTLWFHRGPDNDNKISTATIPKQLLKLHLFTQMYWLEDFGRTYGGWIPHGAPSLRQLRITVRHSDWWLWESHQELSIDKKWAAEFYRFENLRVLELELETVEGKERELDDVVRNVGEWRFPMREGRGELVCNKCKTKRTGWWGERLGESELFFASLPSLS